MVEHKGTILFLSDSPLTTTGFSTQSHGLANRLSDKGWRIHYMAHNYMGQRLPPNGFKLMDGTTNNYFLYGVGRAPYCQDLITPFIKEIKPDVFYVLLDTFMLYPWYLNLDTSPAKTTWWYPSDGGGGLPKGCEQIIARVNLPVAMAKFGQKQVKDYYGLNTEYIPHAVDEKLFSRMNDDERNKTRANWGFTDKFVVGAVYRNQPRKFADRMFKAFARFSKGKEDVVLFCHTDPSDNAASFDTFALVKKLKIENKVVFSGLKYYDSFTYEKLREVYNLMDVYISSTSGEGFGIPIVEAMACEVPIVMPSYTTGDELVRHHNSGEVVKCVGIDDVDFNSMSAIEYDGVVENGVLLGGWEVDRAVMDINDCASKLDKLYLDWKAGGLLLKEYGKNGRKAAMENYTWEIIAESWNQKLSELVNK